MEENKIIEGVNENAVSNVSKGNVGTKLAIGSAILTGVVYGAVKAVKYFKNKKANNEVVDPEVSADENEKSEE